MPKSDELYLGHMLDTARKAYAKVQGMRRADFDRDENLRLALAHLIQVIGGAAQRVSIESRQVYPEIPWREITGIRHKIVHDYMNVNDDVIWQVVTDDLPDLIGMLEKIVPPSI